MTPPGTAKFIRRWTARNPAHWRAPRSRQPELSSARAVSDRCRPPPELAAGRCRARVGFAAASCCAARKLLRSSSPRVSGSQGRRGPPGRRGGPPRRRPSVAARRPRGRHRTGLRPRSAIPAEDGEAAVGPCRAGRRRAGRQPSLEHQHQGVGIMAAMARPQPAYQQRGGHIVGQVGDDTRRTVAQNFLP